jgi:hypothetical protein
MKFLAVTFLLLLGAGCYAQDAALKKEFCDNLNEVLESGRRENFESLKSALFKTVPLMDTHQPNLKLPGFPKLGIDKDQRFVAKTLISTDSLSAIRKLDELKPYVLSCLDSTKWTWDTRTGDDTTTVFFKEYKELLGTDGTITITLAMVGVANNVYSDNMYIRRNNTRLRR